MIDQKIKLLILLLLSEYAKTKVQEYSFIDVVIKFFMVLYLPINGDGKLTLFCGGFPP